MVENRPSSDPRDQALRAALQDASTLAAMVSDELRATYHGPQRDVYLRTLAGYVADLDGRVTRQGSEVVLVFAARRIALRFR